MPRVPTLYGGTSLTRKRPPQGPYRRPMSRVLGGVIRGWAFSYERGTPVVAGIPFPCKVQSFCSNVQGWGFGCIFKHEREKERPNILNIRPQLPLLMGSSTRDPDYS